MYDENEYTLGVMASMTVSKTVGPGSNPGACVCANGVEVNMSVFQTEVSGSNPGLRSGSAKAEKMVKLVYRQHGGL